MQVKNLQPVNWKYYIALAVVAAVAYWPLSLGIYALKNDAITYFLPYRVQVSEAIQSGYFPWWSPFIYTGLPLHADMQSGVWNPLVMLISLFTRYNMTVLQLESFFYIVTGGIGFFKLCRHFGLAGTVSFFSAASYMCCGFMADSTSFIPWITSAAYMPFVFLYFFRLNAQPSLAAAIRLGLASSLLLLAGYASFFIVTTYFLAIVFFATLIQEFNNRAKISPWLKLLFVSVILAVLICSPALISWIEFFPYYERGQVLPEEAAQQNPFAIKNSISYLFPSASYKLDTINDTSSRNAFIGITSFLFVIFSFRYGLNRIQKWLLFAAAICFLYSLGSATPVRGLLYHLPFMGYFRHPANIRLFTSASLILFAAFGMHQFFSARLSRVFFKKIIIATIVFILVVIGWNLFAEGNIKYLQINLTGSGVGTLRSFLDHSTFSVWLLISGGLQILFLLFLFFARSKKAILSVSVINLVIMLFLAMPFSMISQDKTKDVDAFVRQFPTGYPSTVASEPVSDIQNNSLSVTRMGYLPFYEKKISIQDRIITPTINSGYDQFLKNETARKEIAGKPFAYLSTNDSLIINGFNPAEFSFKTHTGRESSLHVTQQFHHRWKAFVNDRPVSISRDFGAFMKLQLPAGSSDIRLVYDPGIIRIAVFFSALLFLLSTGVIVYFRMKS